MFFQDWSNLGRTLLIGTLAYLALLFILRISGKRTLSKWNSFDFIVTIAFGSTLATAILSKETSLSQSATGFAVLTLLQFVITWLSVRFSFIRKLIKSEPALLLYEGKFIEEALIEQRVTRSEVIAAMREHGISSIKDAGAVILETDGSVSVIKDISNDGSSTLQGVKGYEYIKE